ncbi:cytochrome c biogenesis protein CcdA [uncultured Tenacibaculum sp.]|uniref:cytochrome c biogenesis CcdA family protein n=1 Tax=uncultured Tenacibaculum sp. TaxID=174713 RepID=UPI002629ECE6|nr:cytochrome c biogenesis protein CcdA [uncultured Tenacibaculum sp.]
MLENIQEWTNAIIENQLNSPLFFIAVFMLGVIAAIGSACNLGVLAAVTSYAGSEASVKNKKSHIKTGLSFLLGNIISLSLIGALTGIISVSIGQIVGKYWTIIAGVLVVYLGLMSLNMLPFNLKIGGSFSSKIVDLTNKSFLFGLLLGGFATACSVGCSPIFPIVLGTSYLQGSLFLSWLTLFVFAIGYSIPLGTLLIGMGFGFSKASDKLLQNKQIINQISGISLILLGFGLLLGWI